ncbi:MAG: CHAD domain-containing protein [Acidobacteria bacterium]|nr:MAG: CHAD domain-containing protein [Acidobacteriota bacterium]
MAHLNGHAGHNTLPDGSPTALPRNGGALEARKDQVQSQDADAEREVSGGENKGARQGEWARVSELALKHLDRCVSLEPKVLQGDDPDAIHDLRVATRRLQQAISLIYPSPRSGEVRKLYRGLKRCRKSLSEIRNYDVLLERVGAALARKHTARRQAWEAIGEYLRGLRSVRLEKSLRKLAKANLSSIYVRLKEFLPADGTSACVVDPSASNGAEHHLEAEQFYERIGHALEDVWAELEREIAHSHHERDASVLHRTRIAAKRARYLIEVIHAFEAPGSREALIWLRSLQTQLGDWHDLVVFEESVIGMLADRNFLRDHLEMAIQVERLIMRNRTLKSKLEKKYFEMIRDRTGFLKTREWVRRMVDSPAALFADS